MSTTPRHAVVSHQCDQWPVTRPVVSYQCDQWSVTRPVVSHQASQTARLAIKRTVYVLNMSVRLFSRLLPNLRTWYFENVWTNFTQTGTSVPRSTGIKLSTLGISRSKVNVTRRRRPIWRPDVGINLDPLGFSRYSSLSTFLNVLASVIYYVSLLRSLFLLSVHLSVRLSVHLSVICLSVADVSCEKNGRLLPNLFKLNLTWQGCGSAVKKIATVFPGSCYVKGGWRNREFHQFLALFRKRHEIGP